MGMLSFLKAPEHIGTALNAVIKTGDALVYTQEEQAEMRMKMANIHLDHIKATAGENNETSVARRWLATIITFPFVVLTLGAAVFYAIGELASLESAIRVAEAWTDLAMTQYYKLVMLAATFYFGSHIIKGLKGKG